LLLRLSCIKGFSW